MTLLSNMPSAKRLVNPARGINRSATGITGVWLQACPGVLPSHRWIEVFLDSEGGGVVATNSMLFCEDCSRVHVICDLIPRG